MKTTENYRKLFAENTMRMDAVIYLPLAINDDCADNLLVDYILEQWPDTPDDPFIVAHPRLAEFCTPEEFPEPLDVLPTMTEAQVDGFLARVSRPVMRYDPDGSGMSTFSWGASNYAWLYGRTMDELVERALAWASARDQEQRAKASGVSR